jgi:hypothetical protein
MIACSLISSRCGSLQAKRRSTRCVLRSVLLSAVIATSAWSIGQTAMADNVFIGDAGDNSVKSFDATNGAFSGTFVASATAGLKGPMGMIFTDGQLVVINQNLGNGPATHSGQRAEILQFDTNGNFVRKIVASSDRNAPFFPQGIVRGGPGNTFYVADIGDQSQKCANEGNVKVYDAAGAFLGNLDRQAFTAEFHPRGVVFGPDGLLYVASVACLDPNDPLFNPQIGYILRFNASTKKFVDIFASNATVPDLHRPEGLVFDNNGNLWVTSFRDNSNPNDTDKILKLDGRTGHLLDTLPLWTPGSARAFAHAILFGPGGKLYVPITGSSPDTTGQLRRCDTTTKPTIQCDIIVKANSAGGPLQQPWFLIFRNSNPGTLNYQD